MNNKQLRRNLNSIFCITLFLCMLVLLIGNSMIKSLDYTEKTTIESDIKNKTEAYKIQIQKKLDSKMEILYTLSSFLNFEKDIDLDSLLEILYNANKNNDFLSMSYTSKEGKAVQATLFNNSGIYVDKSEFTEEFIDIIDRSLQGEEVISDVFYSKILHRKVVGMSIPIYYDGEIQGVLAASIDITEFEEILNLAIKSDDKSSYIHMIEKNGDFIVRTNNRIDLDETSSIYDMGVSLLDKNEVMNALNNGEEYYAEFNLEKDKYEVCFSPLEYRNWYIVYITPLVIENSPAIKMLHITRNVFICITIFIIFLIISLYLIIRNSNKKLIKLAFFDKLTGAYNATHFRNICESKLKKNNNYSIVVFNINKFKFINDIFGEKGANELLCYIKSVLDKNTNQEEYYCLDNADQFIMLVNSINKDEILNRINIIRNEISNFSDIKNQNYDIKIYVGICNYIKQENKAITYKIMYDNALFSMKQARKTKEYLSFYDYNIHRDMYNQNFIERNMDEALYNKEFKLFLQPKIDLKTKKVVSAEALVRWIRDDGTMIFPNDFIPIFEQNGFCEKLDIYMIEQACKKLKEWRESGISNISISINQSKLLFYKSDYIESICCITKKYGVPNSLITLEILEGLTIHNFEQFNKTIKELHKKGFKVSMDDFGSGYSSFNTLSKLKIDELKIDRDFLLKIDKDNENKDRQRIILKSIISLAKELKIETVVEGVETEENLELISSLGCDMAQGYYFSRPLSVKDFEDKYIN